MNASQDGSENALDWIRRYLLSPLFQWANSTIFRAWIIPVILRALTFTELGLTHTCCAALKPLGFMFKEPPPRPNDEEICNIRYTEEKDIAPLGRPLD
ncbi:hypothetical protein K469DRAFT_211472 [Zopfia rhizophila CBS 207.26]|uniref:Uncharacterized protein n=1 Tax=Zopfia rhizophila CBS 207.26 TaxID=1314779 RepID=A0A6A6DYQ6_9PEZI|nr:hypothetical protein K469DRAFT_211472 [Zopfia rhizophila CBS 207.26]